MKLKKFGLAALAATAVLTVASCGPNEATTTTKEQATTTTAATTTEEDNFVYEQEVHETDWAGTADYSQKYTASENDTTKVAGLTAEELKAKTGISEDNDLSIAKGALSKFDKTYAAGKAKATNSEKFVEYAKAEAQLLASAVFTPTTTRGGNYAITRVGYRTGTYALWGSDEYRYKDLLVTDNLIKASDREALRALYQEKKGTGTYHAAAEAYLTSHGYTLQDTYKYSYSEANKTWDWLATSMASDTEVTTNLVDGLVEYDSENNLVPALATEVPTGVYNAKSNTTKYTFKLKQGVYWAKNTDGTATTYEVTADDFVAGFQHMLDAAGGLEYLVDGVIRGASEYLYENGSFDKVGVKAVDKYTVEYEVLGNPSYFLTYLAYNIYQPMNREFFLSKGGKFGIENFATAAAAESYTYGTTRADVLTCGAYYTSAYSDGAAIQFKQNPQYWAVTDTDTKNDPKIKTIDWGFNDGSDQLKAYKDAKAGTLSGAGLNTAAQAQAKEDGLFDTYAYVSETQSTTYFAANNLNRQTYVLANGGVKSDKDVKAAVDTNVAMQNQNFRLALARAFDKVTWNAASVGEAVAKNAIRNMYTPYDFVALTEDVKDGDKTFAKGTDYGAICEYYLEKELGTKIDLHDSQDGWYNATAAKALLDKAWTELAGKVSGDKIQIDIMYYGPSAVQTAQAKAYKASIEAALGEHVVVNTIAATTTDDYYACGYRSKKGSTANYDVFYGSGWAPDYGDPTTYLDTFLSEGAGYMCKTIGLW